MWYKVEKVKLRSKITLDVVLTRGYSQNYEGECILINSFHEGVYLTEEIQINHEDFLESLLENFPNESLTILMEQLAVDNGLLELKD